MIKSLLVAVDSSAHAQAALEHAVELARLYQARVTGLHVLDIRYLEMPPYLDYSYAFEAVPPILAPLDVMDKSRAKAERVLGEVRALVEKAGAGRGDPHRGRGARSGHLRHRGGARSCGLGQAGRARQVGPRSAGLHRGGCDPPVGRPGAPDRGARPLRSSRCWCCSTAASRPIAGCVLPPTWPRRPPSSCGC